MRLDRAIRPVDELADPAVRRDVLILLADRLPAQFDLDSARLVGELRGCRPDAPGTCRTR